jgi:hypothetical protein
LDSEHFAALSFVIWLLIINQLARILDLSWETPDAKDRCGEFMPLAGHTVDKRGCAVG